MKFSNLKILVAISALFAYAASAAFYQQNGGMVLQQAVITAAAGTTTLVATSNQVQIVEGATTQTIKLPSAITLPVGWHYELVNNSSGTVTVTDNSGTTVLTLTGGRAGRAWMTARATAAGTWKTTIYPAPGDIITDHGGLSGLSDDDHTQYHNDSRGDARYFRENEHVSTSSGSGDAGKPIVLNGSGLVDSTMLPAAGSSWSLTGNSGLDASTNFIGNTDAVDVVFKSNNSEVMRLTSAGLIDTGLTGSRVLVTDASGSLAVSTADSAYMVVTGSPIQTQLDGKEPSFTTLGVTKGGTGTSTQFTVGSAIFAGASGVYAQDNANFFWDDTNNRLALGHNSPSYLLDLHASASSETVLSLDPTTGSDVDFRFESTLFRIDVGLSTLLSFGSGNMNLNGTAASKWNVQHNAAATQTTLSNYLLRDQGYPVMAVKNTSSTANNASGLAFAGNSNASTEASSGILGVHESHTGSAETGHLEFWTRNAGTAANRFNIAKDGALTASAYTAGLAQFSSAGVVSSLAGSSSGDVPTWNGSAWIAQAPSSAAPTVNTYTANQTLTESNQDVYCNVATSDMVLTLYSAASGTRKAMNIKNISQTGTCTIRPTSAAQAIFVATGNEAELILAPGGTAVNLRPDGSSTWYVH